MTPEKILEIARLHTSPIEGELDCGTVTYWELWEEELLAFAQAIIKEEREKCAKLIEAAEAVTTRWDSSLWKDAGPTAKVVYRMRVALERMKEKSND